MTEAEWLACQDPAPMLKSVRDKASERQLRLFACACCRKVLHLMKDARSRQGLLAAERLADGGAGARRGRAGVAKEAKAAAEEARQLADAAQDPAEHLARLAECCAAWAAYFVVQPSAGDSADNAVGHASLALAYASCKTPKVLTSFPPDRERMMRDAMREQAGLLRDIIGSPFDRRTVDHTWLRKDTNTILTIAQAVYEQEAFTAERMRVLADALEEAGAVTELVDHLLSPGPHVRGCWVVDLILSTDR